MAPEARITVRRLVAWHVAMVVVLVLLWLEGGGPFSGLLCLVAAVSHSFIFRPVSPAGGQRVAAGFSSMAICMVLAGLGLLVMFLYEKSMAGTAPVYPPVHPRTWFWGLLVILPVLSFLLIRQWRRQVVGIEGPPSVPARTEVYTCPACRQQDEIAVGPVFREPLVAAWDCGRCGQRLEVTMKHPFMNGLLQFIFLGLFLTVSWMKLCPLWISSLAYFVATFAIQRLTRGVEIVPKSPAKGFLDAEMEG